MSKRNNLNRANLRCLGLTVGIAIALAGCDGDLYGQEISGDEYAMLTKMVEEQPELALAVREALADKKITNGEADSIGRLNGTIKRSKARQSLAHILNGDNQ